MNRTQNQFQSNQIAVANLLISNSEKTLQEAFGTTAPKEEIVTALWTMETPEQVLRKWNAYLAKKQIAAGSVVTHAEYGAGVVLENESDTVTVLFMNGVGEVDVMREELALTGQVITNIDRLKSMYNEVFTSNAE